jgi:hypothetical protein
MRGQREALTKACTVFNSQDACSLTQLISGFINWFFSIVAVVEWFFSIVAVVEYCTVLM